MSQPTTATRLLLGYVEKIGGIEKARRYLAALQAITARPDKREAAIAFVRRAVKNDAAAQQLFADSLLGVALAVHLYPSLADDMAKAVKS